jgi:hypothetical protein
MIKQHFVRGFERGARRDHTPNIGLKRGVCQVTFETEDSNSSLHRPNKCHTGVTRWNVCVPHQYRCRVITAIARPTFNIHAEKLSHNATSRACQNTQTLLNDLNSSFLSSLLLNSLIVNLLAVRRKLRVNYGLISTGRGN